MACRRLLRAGALPDFVPLDPESRRRLADRTGLVRAGARWLGLAVAPADGGGEGELFAGHLSPGHRSGDPARVPAGAPLLPRPRGLSRAPGPALSPATAPHLGPRR